MDRMEIIRIAGYTEDEKLEIAKRHLLPHSMTKHGLDAKEWVVEDSAIMALIRRFTREAGVRNLEREIGTVLRSVAVRIAEGEVPHMRIGPDDLAAMLGPRKFEAEVAMRSGVPGVATMLGHRVGQQLPLGDLQFLVFRVAGDTNDLHSIHERRRMLSVLAVVTNITPDRS